jgi:hypothetical protein
MPSMSSKNRKPKKIYSILPQTLPPELGYALKLLFYNIYPNQNFYFHKHYIEFHFNLYHIPNLLLCVRESYNAHACIDPYFLDCGG